MVEAQAIIASRPGYLPHDLRCCLEDPHRYLLLVKGETLESPPIGFRQSREYLKWQRLLHHCYDPFPTVAHFESVIEGARGA